MHVYTRQWKNYEEMQYQVGLYITMRPPFGIVCVCAYVSVCLSLCLSTCMDVHMYVCMYVCMHVCVYACIYVYVCMYLCMHACIVYVHVHIHVQINTHKPSLFHFPVYFINNVLTLNNVTYMYMYTVKCTV